MERGEVINKLEPQQTTYAGLWTRTLAFAFDYGLIFLYLVTLTVVGLIVNLVFPDIRSTLFADPLSAELTGIIVLTLPVTLYFALFESSAWQATWGKRHRGLKVTRSNGERLTRPRALARNILKFVPWELAHACIWQISFVGGESSPLISIGFVLVWVLVGANIVSLWISPRRQTLYDRLAGTCVVQAS